MELSTFNSRMRQEVSEYAHGRSESSAFLVWFLINYFRLEKQDAVDSSCDNTNDKGIDGVWVDDEEEVIYLFQAKYSPVDGNDQGDADIRTFVGSRVWFETEAGIDNLLASTTSNELKSLIINLDLKNKNLYKINLVFVTNKQFDIRGNEYLETLGDKIEPYDVNALYEGYTLFADEDIEYPELELYVSSAAGIKYDLPEGINVRVYPVKATELLKMSGIQDRTLFYKNVRYGVGETRVNRSIKATILDQEEHNNFFLYHNGITVISEILEESSTGDRIKIKNYTVINGCQSLLTLYENRGKLTRNLFILTKFIKLRKTNPLLDKITKYANNQNPIGIKDLRSNDPAQRALVRQFTDVFGTQVGYIRKKGQDASSYSITIDKDLAAQLIEATYLESPHSTHLKQKLFSEEYGKIFSRRMTAEKIFLAYLVHSVVKGNVGGLSEEKIRSYGLALFFFDYVMFDLLSQDELGRSILDDPRIYVTEKKSIFENAIKKLWEMTVSDINFELNEHIREVGYFDYKNVFKNKTFVTTMCSKIKRDYLRSISRDAAGNSFSGIYRSFDQPPVTPVA